MRIDTLLRGPRLPAILLTGTLAATGAIVSFMTSARAAPRAAEAAKSCEPERVGGVLHDWDWLMGSWTVKHRRLKARLAGSTEWQEFNGSSVVRSTMASAGTVDDCVIELPGGTYRAVAIRAFDPKTSLWSIWWLDERRPTAIEPPVMGSFKDGVGTFMGDDTLNGKPIKVRFTWSKITANSAHWEQAFSPDGGVTWEMNWAMDFTRTRS